MLHEQTKNRLYEMKLNGMADAYAEQAGQPKMLELSFEDRFAMLVERQWHWKETRALQSRLAYAHLKEQACTEDIDYMDGRGLKRAVIDQLARCEWLTHHQHVIVTGPTGTGKTYLACALAQKACRLGYRSVYFCGSKLFRELELAQADGSLPGLLKKIERAQLLVVDDWGMAKLDDRRCRDFLEILDDRHGSGSVLITSQFPVSKWHETIPDPTVADAILDRLIHNSHKIELKGDSMRKRRAH